ncbi:MAG TPA: hypothetical protein VID72_06090 [Ktedonobacterales bacterium]
MTQRTDYTSDEWTLLTETIQLVGLGMLAVSPGGPTGKQRKLRVLSSCMTPSAVPLRFKRHALVRALLEDASGQAFRRSAYPARGDVSTLMVALADAQRRMLASCERVADLLASRTPAHEAKAAKRWLLWVATTVAEASGRRWLRTRRKASAEEVSLLDQLATSLDIALIVDAPTPSELETLLGLTPLTADVASACNDGQEHRFPTGA